MEKRKLILGVAFSVIVFVCLYSLIFSGFNLLGFVVYGAAMDFCGANVYESSSFSTGQVCDGVAPSTNGGIINTSGVILNCGYAATGEASTNTFGLKINASNATVINCNFQNFGYNLNISGNNSLVINTAITGGTFKNQSIISPGMKSTWINVSFASSAVQVLSGAQVHVQYYVLVNVTDAAGAVVSGASVGIWNESALASQLAGTTDASGYARFNVTQMVKENAGDTNFSYLVNATYLGTTAANRTFKPSPSTGTMVVSLRISDASAPLISIISPLNKTYASTTIDFNVSLNENTSWCGFSLNGTANVTMTRLNDTLFGYTKSGLGQGQHNISFVCNDTSGNMNVSSGLRVFAVDSVAPLVTIISPAAGTYSVNSYDVNISLNEGGYCEYSVNAGAANLTLTANSTNTGFTGSVSGASNGAYTLWAYCNDSAGNRNDTTNVSFIISVSSGGDTGGGGGGSCTDTTWTCESWSECADGNQTRECVSNCAKTKIESQSCTACTNECSNEGTYCAGNKVETCKYLIAERCYRIIYSKECGNESCVNGECTLVAFNETKEIKKEKNIDAERIISAFSGYFANGTAYRPSSWIPHGNIPDIVVDAGAATAGVAVVAGVSWWVWLWILGLLLPLLAIKLKHYSVSVFDADNRLKIFDEKGKIDKKRAIELLYALEKHYGKLVFAEREGDVVKYVAKEGFVEVRLDSPFIITGHFSNRKSADAFASALRSALNRYGGEKDKIMMVVERASIIRALRAYMRKRRSERELRRVMNK
jgi:hypothetical protein